MPSPVHHIAATGHATITSAKLVDLISLLHGESCQAVGTAGRNFREYKHRLVKGVDYCRAGGDEIRRHINPGHAASASEVMPAPPEFQHSPGSQGSKIPRFESWNIRILGGNLEPDACATVQRFGKVGPEIAPLPGSATAQKERSALMSEDQALRGTITLPPLAEVSADVLGEGVCEKFRTPYEHPQNGQACSPPQHKACLMVPGERRAPKFSGTQASELNSVRNGTVRGQADAWPQGNSGSLPELNEINGLDAEAPKARIKAVQGVSA